VLEEHRQQQEDDKRNFGADYQDQRLVFCQPNGYYYSPNNVGLGVKELPTKAGLKGFSLHSLRHSHASVLLGQGVPPRGERPAGTREFQCHPWHLCHALPADVRAASKAWRNALADTIAEGRSRKQQKMLVS
jgi:hypothetical protein